MEYRTKERNIAECSASASWDVTPTSAKQNAQGIVRRRNMRKKQDLSTEMGWLRKILGVSRLQKVRSDTVGNILEQEETIIVTIQKTRLTWFGHVQLMEDNRHPHKELHC